jgi:hypothetical protein
MLRLTYFSTRASDVDASTLARQAAVTNKARGITGVLISDDRTFLQVIEGERNAVSDLFITLARDPRHRDIALVEAEPISGRAFPDWGMASLHDVTRIARLWATVDGSREFNPAAMTAREIRDFVRLVSFELLKVRAPGA